jgi:hypothetical protein
MCPMRCTAASRREQRWRACPFPTICCQRSKRSRNDRLWRKCESGCTDENPFPLPSIPRVWYGKSESPGDCFRCLGRHRVADSKLGRTAHRTTDLFTKGNAPRSSPLGSRSDAGIEAAGARRDDFGAKGGCRNSGSARSEDRQVSTLPSCAASLATPAELIRVRCSLCCPG